MLTAACAAIRPAGWTLALLSVPAVAKAQYLDPGTGSMLLQGLLALVGASLVTVAIYWRAVRTAVRRLFGRRTEAPDDRESGS